jgi:metallo-beta-lactamase class B
MSPMTNPGRAVLAASLWGLALLHPTALPGEVARARAGDAEAPAAVDLGGDVSVEQLLPGFWRHVSVRADGVPSNGLVATLSDGALLVDTAWNDEQTGRILDWAAKSGRPIAWAVVTHSHDDRLGGIGELRRRGIPVAGLDLTAARARAAGLPAPDVLFPAARRVHKDRRGFEAFHPGHGHAPDNVVVWFARAGVLFGGCLVKEERAQHMGFIGDADLASWQSAIGALQKRYPQARLVVPGHGDVGGPAALERTLVLLRAAIAEAASPETK